MCYALHMKKGKIYKIINFILLGNIVGTLCGEAVLPLTVHATTVNGLQNQINTHKSELQNIYNQIAALEGEQDILQEEIDDLNAEILNIMTDIGLKEDEIAAKEEEIAQKQVQIAESESEYEAAKALEEAQRAEMAVSTRLVYERGTGSYIGALLASTGLAEILNQLDFVEKIYAYERSRLLGYMELKEQVQQLREKLELEKTQLEADRLALEGDKASLEQQRASLDGMLEAKRQESTNFEAEIAKAKQEATKAKEQIQKEETKLKQLQAQLAAQQAAQNAANATYATTAYSAVIDAAEGSELGKQIARYACQFIGNPYVWGGTSLTNGADCSGFTYRIYANFGYKISRSSNVQQSDGIEVSYDEIQPGDIICYEGHVAMYIGGDLIVHASNSKPYPQGGIKVSNAKYREILTIRRIIQ